MEADPAAGSVTDEVAVVTEHEASKKTMSEEDKPKRKPVAMVKREAKVVEVKIEKVEEDFINYIRKNPMRRPSNRSPRFFKLSPRLVELRRVFDASINKIVDLHEHILEQYDTKGYAMVLAEYLDNGRKRRFRLPEEEGTAAA